MSNPINPLAKFRSYSYYHVLAVCDTSVTASELSHASNPNLWQHAQSVMDSPDIELLGKYAPKTTPNGGRYIVLINGAEDADLIIEKVQYYSTVAGMAVDGDGSSSIACEGVMRISEPYGMNFFDVMTLALLSLEVDVTSASFLLKTFFIGHTDSGSVETISTVAPLEILISDMKAKVSEAGGIYNLDFVAQAGGAARMPLYSKVGTGVKMAVTATAGDDNVTLSRAMTTLENKLATQYESQYVCMVTSVEFAQSEAGLQEDIAGRLSRINYYISLDDMYDESYLVTDGPSEYKDVGLCNEGVYVDSGPNANIESVIRSILNRCPKIAEDANGVGSDNSKFVENTKITYKIKSVVRTTRGEGDLIEHNVYYHVFPVRVADEVPSYDIVNLNSSGSGANILELNYTYTGMNTDIIKFDIEMPYGLMYLQTASITNTFLDQLEVVSSRTTTTPNLLQKLKAAGPKSRLPVPFGTQVTDPQLTNTQHPVGTANSLYTISEAAEYNQPSVTIEILGNPSIMSMINASHDTDPAYFTASVSEIPDLSSVDLANETTQVVNVLNDWQGVPSFVKINVNMPANNDPLQLMRSGSFSRPFWYQGYYWLITVNNKFEDSVFTQELELITRPDGALTPEATQQMNIFGASFQQGTNQCYDNRVSASPNQNMVAYQNAEPFPSYNPESEKVTAHALERIQANRQLCAVTGWNRASAHVKDAILEAAEMYGTDPVLLAMFAFKESNFNPAAKAPGSSASGLYQHINSTWDMIVTQGRIKGLPANTPRELARSKRFDARFSARGGASYINEVIRIVGSNTPGNVYLGYFSGPGTAKKIVNGSRSGMLLRTALGDTLTGKMIKANPTIISWNTTCLDMVRWADRAMQIALKGSCPPEAALPPEEVATVEEVETTDPQVTGGGGSSGGAGASNSSGSSGSWEESTDTEMVTTDDDNIPIDAGITAISRGAEGETSNPVDHPITRTSAEAISAATDPTIIAKQQDSVCGTNKLPTSDQIIDSSEGGDGTTLEPGQTTGTSGSW